MIILAIRCLWRLEGWTNTLAAPAEVLQLTCPGFISELHHCAGINNPISKSDSGLLERVFGDEPTSTGLPNFDDEKVKRPPALPMNSDSESYHGTAKMTLHLIVNHEE